MIEMEVVKPVVRFVNVTMSHIDCGRNPHLTFKSDLVLSEGDHVVCDTRLGLHIGIVVGFIPIEKEFTLPNNIVWKHIIQKIDLTEHNARMEKAARLLAIMQEMEARQAAEEVRLARIDALTPFFQTAENDPQMAKLLEEYKELSDEF